MILFPAIDLKDGACVRLQKGLMEKATVFNLDPGAQARAFQDSGFEWLHLVDLNGAFEGKAVNAEAVKTILKSVSIPIQLGGGIRNLSKIETWLDAGITRVILGTIALTNPDIVIEACKKFPGKIVVGIDAKGGKVAVEGWAKTSDITAIELAKRFADVGVAAIIFTDINRDGILTGLNIESTLEVAESSDIPVIASGGLASMKDIERLSEPDCRILEGAISGRALYDGKINPAKALATLRANKVEGQPC